MKLNELLAYDNIVVQCHDNPDADALASGFGVLRYLRDNGRNCVFVYGGRFKMTKSNLILMCDELSIDVRYVTGDDDVSHLLGGAPQLLVTVDCQYGQGNVTGLSAPMIAVIDHHQVSCDLPKMSEARSHQGSCSTVVWDMLSDEGLDVNDTEELATALYYGLMTDTGNFVEIHHPLDRDMQEVLKIRNSAITKFRNSNISKEELEIAGEALGGTDFIEEYKTAIVQSRPCDPNILGIISDMTLEVDCLDTCLVYSILPGGVKLSVRSCSRETKANELAEYLAEGIGSGGGHIVKAGGFLQRELIEKSGVTYEPDSVRAMLRDRLIDYFKSTEIIDTDSYVADMSQMQSYAKKRLSLGYVPSVELAEEGEEVVIRTLEGDIELTISNDTYVMIGILGEIYPINRNKFDKTYEVCDGEYKMPSVFETSDGYRPILKRGSDGSVIEVLQHARPCISAGGSLICAKRLDKRVKVFTAWDKENYYLGKPGDYMAAIPEDPSDVYIIRGDIFAETYERV